MSSPDWRPAMATISGVLVILAFSIFTLASAARYPGSFSPLDNWLSDLGTMAKNPGGYTYFNTGCILTGILTLLLVHGMGAWQVKKYAGIFTLGRAAGGLSAAVLMLIGVFDENSPYHGSLSILFFLLMGLFLILTNAALWPIPAYRRWAGYYALVAIVVDAALGITYFAYEHAPVWEWLAVFGTLAWVGLLAHAMRDPEAT